MPPQRPGTLSFLSTQDSSGIAYGIIANISWLWETILWRGWKRKMQGLWLTNWSMNSFCGMAPERIHSDQGRNFEAQMFQMVVSLFIMKSLWPYHLERQNGEMNCTFSTFRLECAPTLGYSSIQIKYMCIYPVYCNLPLFGRQITASHALMSCLDDNRDCTQRKCILNMWEIYAEPWTISPWACQRMSFTCTFTLISSK